MKIKTDLNRISFRKIQEIKIHIRLDLKIKSLRKRKTLVFYKTGDYKKMHDSESQFKNVCLQEVPLQKENRCSKGKDHPEKDEKIIPRKKNKKQEFVILK